MTEKENSTLNTKTEETSQANETGLLLSAGTPDKHGRASEQTKVAEKKGSNFSKRVFFLLTSSGFLFISIIIFGVVLFSEDKKKETEEVQRVQQASSIIDPFDSVSISAKAAYVFDIQTNRVLFSKNNEAQLPLASITKLMTAVVATEKLSLDSIVSIKQSALAAEGDSGLVLGEKWNVKDLISFTLLVSSNDGAQALAYAAGAINKDPNSKAEEVFTNFMNEKAEELGLTQTYFLNPTGLDTNKYTSGGYGSAQDIVSLLYYALAQTHTPLGATREPSVFYLSLDNTLHGGDNTNQATGNIPGLIASKTGFTDLAGGNLVIAFDAGMNHPVLIAVLGSTAEGRFKDVELLVQKTLDALALQVGEYPLE